VDINSRNNADYTALHESCAGGHCDVASCLIQFGANVHAVSQLDGARFVVSMIRGGAPGMATMASGHGYDI